MIDMYAPFTLVGFQERPGLGDLTFLEWRREYIIAFFSAHEWHGKQIGAMGHLMYLPQPQNQIIAVGDDLSKLIATAVRHSSEMITEAE
jgi:hypothetical protein